MGIMVPDNIDISSLGYLSDMGRLKKFGKKKRRRPVAAAPVVHQATVWSMGCSQARPCSSADCPPGMVFRSRTRRRGGVNRCVKILGRQYIKRLSDIGCPSCGLGDWKSKLKDALKKGKGALQSKLKDEVAKRLNPQAAGESGGPVYQEPPAPSATPFYKNPMVIAGGIAGVVILGAILLRKK